MIYIKKLLLFIIAVLILGTYYFKPNFVVELSQSFSQEYIKISQPIITSFAKEETDTIKYSQYDNINILGSQVILGEQMFSKDGVIISIKTLKDLNYKKYNKTNLYNIKDKNNPSFINVSNKFKSILKKDSKNKVVDIIFTEIK